MNVHGCEFSFIDAIGRFGANTKMLLYPFLFMGFSFKFKDFPFISVFGERDHYIECIWILHGLGFWDNSSKWNTFKID